MLYFVACLVAWVQDEPAGIVVHIESKVVHVGFAGDDAPRIVMANVVGVTKDGKSEIVGDKALERKDELNLVWPVEKGKIQDWDALKKVLAAAFKDLGRAPKDASVLLTEDASSSKQDREKLAQFFIDAFGPGKMYVVTASILSLYASGRTTGVVLYESGGAISTCCIHEGYMIEESLVVGQSDHVKAILKSIEKCNSKHQADLYKNIILAGADVKRDGYPDALMESLTTSSNGMKVKVAAPPELKYSAWIGGSILASLSTFQETWIKSDDLRKNPLLIHNKKKK